MVCVSPEARRSTRDCLLTSSFGHRAPRGYEVGPMLRVSPKTRAVGFISASLMNPTHEILTGSTA
jgi:hypothetical protein